MTKTTSKALADTVAQLETEVTADVAFQFRGGGLKHLVEDYELTKYFSAEDAETIKNARQMLDQADELSYESSFSQKLAIGCTVAAVVLTALSVWLTYSDLCDYYDTDFSPIPNYIVDEADITRKNEKNETVVIKNQTAYYKAALCNRTEKDEKFKEIGDKADLNGDVGRMWVALYSVKNAAQDPILADSFKVVYGTSNVPLDYDRGIHKFGSGAAFDMNNTYYAWNHGKGGIYVYFKLDDTVPPRANAVGTVQTGGMFAAVCVGGILVGMMIGTMLAGRRGRKREETAA